MTPDELEALCDLAAAWEALRWAQEESLDLEARREALTRGDAALACLNGETDG